MDKVEKKSKLKWLDKSIKRLKRATSKERGEDDKREPHKVQSPFGLEAPHTHQDSEQANQSPAIYLACATQPKAGGEEELMGIKLDNKGKEGDPRMVIICKCNNPSEIDNQRKAVAQEIEPGENPIIPPGSHLVSSRAVFLLPSNQQHAGKTVFLLLVTHPAINQNTPKDLIKSAGQALDDIKERLKTDDASHTTEMDDRYFQICMSSPPVPSAPPLEEIVKQEQEQGAAGGDLPYDKGDKVPGAHEDQNEWIHPEAPAEQGLDRTEHMIIIHKKESSQNKHPLKYLANEQLTKIGWSDLKFPDRSQENAKDALPGDIWGYVLRHVQDDNKGAMKGNNKPVTFASFIKKDHQNVWMNKAFKTCNFSSELDITLLMSNANEDKDLIDLKTHFGRWDGEVMTFLYAIIEREEKKGTGDPKQEQQHNDILDELRRAENERQAQEEQTRRLELEHENQLARQKAEFDQRAAEFEQKTKEENDRLDELYKEVSIVEGVIRQSRLQSRRLSRVASSLSSRAPSPTDSSRETLRLAALRLNQTLTEKKLTERKQGAIDQIMNLEVPKTERKSAYISAHEGSAWIESDEEIPLHWEKNASDGEERQKEKIRLHKIQMRLKGSHAPKGDYICPDVDCIYTSSREEKIPTHVLGHHGKNLLLVTQALLERDRIRIAQKEARENQEANKIKQEQEAKEERIQTQLTHLEKAIELVAEQTKREKKPQTWSNPTPAKNVKEEPDQKSNTNNNSGQNDKNPKSDSNPDSTIPGTKKNQYYKGSGSTNGYRQMDAGGYGGGGGDDDDSPNNSDDEGNNSDDEGNRHNRDDSEDEEEHGSCSYNKGNNDEEEVDSKGNTIKRDIVQLHFNQANYITPKCLKVQKISQALDYFVSKEALTRNDLQNVNGAHGTKRRKPQYVCRVAPWFKKKYKSIMKDIGYPNAADEEMTEWYDAWREARKGGEWRDDESRLQVSNGYDQLMESHSRTLKNLLDGAPPLKNRASPDKLTPQDVKKWMMKGRVYCLTRAIYWKTFAKYMITNVTLHPKIKEQLESRINTKTFSTEGAWTITVYIERIILEMLDPEESFNDMEDRLVEKHVRGLQKEESTTQLRAELEDDALQLTYLDPSYIKAKRQGKGYIHEVISKDKMEGIRQRLLVNILKAADYYVDLNELYSFRKDSSTVEQEDERDVITDLTKLLKTKKARKQKEAESRVYSTQPKKPPTATEKALNMKITQLEQQQEKLLLRFKGQPGTDKAPSKPRRDIKDVGLKIPFSEFKNPCHKCESKPGTNKERKDLCAASHHCWNHDGEYMCTKAAECRIRTEKVKALMAFRKKSIPEKASMATIKQIMTYTEEDLREIPADRPCLKGEHCLQQTGGIHSRVCRAQMAEVEALIGEGPDPAAAPREYLEEQQIYNHRPDNGFEEYQVRHSYDYDCGDDQEGQRRESDTHN